MASIFATESSENPVTLIRQTLAVKPDDDGNIMASFTTNKGKGSGAQILPFGEFREAVAVLVDAVANGIPEHKEDETLPASEVIKRTLTIEDGIISFRTKNGKGAKPARIPVAQFAEVVALLSSTIDAVEAAGKKLSK
jgi:protoporphyrinogen oxidase